MGILKRISQDNERLQRECDIRADETLALCKEIDGLRDELAAARVQLSAIRWRKVADEAHPDTDRYVEVLCQQWDAPFIAWYDKRDGSWNDLHGRVYSVVATHWREIGPLPPSDTEPGTP